MIAYELDTGKYLRNYLNMWDVFVPTLIVPSEWAERVWSAGGVDLPGGVVISLGAKSLCALVCNNDYYASWFMRQNTLSSFQTGFGIVYWWNYHLFSRSLALSSRISWISPHKYSLFENVDYMVVWSQGGKHRRKLGVWGQQQQPKRMQSAATSIRAK